MSEQLQYRTVINAGASFWCVEAYESVFERWRGATFAASDSGDVSLAEPMELTFRGEDDRPQRGAVAPQAITSVFELFDDQRVDVAEPG